MQKPSTGRIVHYRPDRGTDFSGVPIAAIVTAAFEMEVDLTYFEAGRPPKVALSVPYSDDPEATTPNRWHWPARV